MNPQETGYKVGDTTKFGGFFRRFVAHVIDSVIQFVIAVFLCLIFAVVFIGTGFFELPDGLQESIFTSWTFLIGWIYEAVLISSSWQATVGKRILSLKVVDGEGNRVSFARATGRFFAKILSALILCIGFLMIGFTKRKQGLHDMIAGTLVIKVKPERHEIY